MSKEEKMKVINDAEEAQGKYPLMEIETKKDDKSFTSTSKEENDSSLKASISILIVVFLLVVFCFILYKTKLSKEDSF